MALTAEDIQKQLEDYFNSDEGKAAIDSITANISDEYTKSEGGGYVRYGNISLEDWQKQNIVTDGNNNTSLSNDQLTQLKTFAAMQPKYDPIKVGGGMGSEIGASATSEADRIRSEELRRTPGPIYTNFAAYSKALQDHNKKIKTYIEDNKIPTSITTPDGIKLELNVGLTPVYYQEQRDGGRLQNTLHMNSDQGYYTQLGGIGQYGSYHRPKLSQSKGFFEGFFKDAAPYFAAFIGAAILGPMAFKYVGSTGMGQFLSTTSSKIIAAVKNAPATFKGIAGAINNTFQGLLTSAGVDAAIAKKVTIDAAGSLAATVKGISYAEQYLDQEDRAAIDAALASATGANGLPGGVVYSGPGAGAEGEINPNVIYNLTAGTTAGATEDEDEDSANTIDATAVVNAAVAAVSTPDENEDVISANTAVSEAEAGVEDATNNVATVVQEENAKVDSAEAYANYVRSRYGVRSFAYRNAKKRADKAKLDAQNEINQARTAASVAQADFENAKKAAIGAQRDAEDEYKKAVAQARRDAEAEVRNKIAKARTDAKAAAEARAAAEETGISEAQDGYSDVAGSAGTYSYDGPETTDYADTTAGQEETKPVEKEEEEVEETKPVEKEEEVEETKPVEKEEEEVEETKPVEKEEEEVEETKPVVTTSDGTDAPATEVKYEEPDEPIEVTTDVEPVEKPEDPPLDIKKPVVEKPVEKPVETTETETDAGGGGGGAGEGAGAGQGGDTGADAEVGTTTAAEKTKVETTETTETPTETADVGLGANEPIDGKWRRDPDDPNGWIHILTGTTFEEGQGGKWRNKSTGEIVEEFTEPEEDEDKPLTEVTGAGTGLGGGADTSSDASASSGTTSGTELGTSGSDTTDTTTTTTTTTTPTAGTDTTTTADTSTGTAARRNDYRWGWYKCGSRYK